jgi:ABC-type sugar transport system ATPase subunit
VPEERRLQGLVPGFTVAENMTLVYLNRFTRYSFLEKKKEKRIAEEHISALSIKTTGASQIIRLLSGGNQQKVVLSKWLSGDFNILILDEPTKGIDIMAKRDIYKLINSIVETGKSVLFMSSYLPELLNICDRILVVNEGSVVGVFTPFDENAQENITHAMLGGKRV